MNDIKVALSLALSLDNDSQTSEAFYKYLESINLIAREFYQHAVFDVQSELFTLNASLLKEKLRK
jgi:hypothetical protein